MTFKLEHTDVKLPKNIDLFICANGFDERWKKIFQTTNCRNAKSIFIINRFGCQDRFQVNNEGIDLERVKLVNIIDENQVTQWNNVFSNIVGIIQSTKKTTVVIDITCIPPLVLYTLICQIHLLCMSIDITFTYSGASNYNINSFSSSDSNFNKITTVLGYPGISKPSCNKQHLILLVGFDFELAKTMIRDLEPTSISLGLGISAFTGRFHELNKEYLTKIEDYALTFLPKDKVTMFEFSCSNYDSAKDSISKEIVSHNEKDIVMCAMNTKISMVASAKCALENDTVKLCHIEPIFRSISDYSECSNVISNFKL